MGELSFRAEKRWSSHKGKELKSQGDEDVYHDKSGRLRGYFRVCRPFHGRVVNVFVRGEKAAQQRSGPGGRLSGWEKKGNSS